MPTRTIPRPKSTDLLTPLQAAYAVQNFIGAPQSSGPWQIVPFTVGKRDELHDLLRSFGDGGGRYTPEGDYIKLRTSDEGLASGGVMMSNTPDELGDHQDLMEGAYGRVLVHGLGLSCVVSGLLANPMVQHVDVVDLDEDVIKMVGPAYKDEDRVTIHHGNALTYEWPDDARWDFAWHDIWATINDDNLRHGTAETGVGYDDLLLRFKDRVTFQQAWALDQSLLMGRAYELAAEEGRAWGERWRASSPDERYTLQLLWLATTNPIINKLREADTGEAIDPAQEVETWRKLIENNPNMHRELLAKAQRDNAAFIPDAPPFIENAKPELPDLRRNYYRELGLSGDGYWAEAPAEERTTAV